MERRYFLGALGATVGIAGCVGWGDGATTEDTPTDTAEQTTETTPEPTTETTPDTTPEPTTETTQKPDTETEPTPADLTVDSLSVDPSEAGVGDDVKVSVIVENVGGNSGTRTVDLQVNGESEASREIALEPGEETTVEFELTADEPGGYNITVGELQGRFEVIARPDLTIDNQGLSTADTVFHNSYAEALVENTGNAPCGRIELTARWFDDSGSFVGEDTTYLPTLGAGEVWVARVGTSRETGEIDDFELSGEYETSLGNSPDGLSVVDSTFTSEDEHSGEITAEIENNREESLFMVSFSGLIYDDDGRVIGGRSTRESDISAGEDLFFEVSLSTTRTAHLISEASDHRVELTESETGDTGQI